MEKYYYIRDNENRPTITVCLIQTLQGEIGRGLAICSKLDQPCKKTGRFIAKGRACYALGSKKNGLELKRMGLPFDAFEFGFPKAYYNPSLTQHERKLFRDRGIV